MAEGRPKPGGDNKPGKAPTRDPRPARRDQSRPDYAKDRPARKPAEDKAPGAGSREAGAPPRRDGGSSRPPRQPDGAPARPARRDDPAARPARRYDNAAPARPARRNDDTARPEKREDDAPRRPAAGASAAPSGRPARPGSGSRTGAPPARRDSRGAPRSGGATKPAGITLRGAKPQQTEPARAVKQDPRWFAVLQTDHPPKESVKLVGTDADGARIEVSFELLQYAEAEHALFGVASGGAGYRLPPFSKVQVQRGRAGAKQPEALQILVQVTPDVQAWPHARWAGFAKGAVRALQQLCGEAHQSAPMLEWLSVELALHGYVPRREAAKAAQTLGAVNLAADGPVVQVGELLVWKEYLTRQCDELEGRIRELQQRNPFITSASREQVQRWLKLDHPELAGRVLRHFCERSGFTVGRSLLGPVVRLGKLHDSISPRDFTTANGILDAINEDRITTKHELQTARPAQQHIAAWLVDAGAIVDCGGYLFTREVLLAALDKLRIKRQNVALAGVRDIKDLLGYHRRKAEGLRAFIVQRFGAVQEAAAPETEDAR